MFANKLYLLCSRVDGESGSEEVTYGQWIFSKVLS